MSAKKAFKRNKLLKPGQYMPASNRQLQLSVTFSHKFLSRYQYDIFEQSWTMCKRLLLDGAAQQQQARPGPAYGWEGTEVVVGGEGGFAAAVVSLMARDRLIFRTEVPDQLVVLDPNLAMVDNQYVRVLQKYKELMRNSGTMDESVSTNGAIYYLNPRTSIMRLIAGPRRDRRRYEAAREKQVRPATPEEVQV